jgi:NADP-dependent 3-hydroxy acid dehydrogenase YdfG
MTTTTAPQAAAPAAHPLTGRVAVVTGASSGIGEATARTLAAGGAKVALLARRRDRIDALAAELGDTALALGADVTHDEELATAADEVAERLGRVDLVVANAGVMLPAAIDKLEAGDWRTMLHVNVGGVLGTVRAFLPSLLAAAEEGHQADLVTISSIAARQRFPDYTVYGGTKAAVTAIAEGLRVDLSARGVRVTNLEPGLVESELRENITDPEAREAGKQWEAQIPPIGALDVGDLIAYLTSRPRQVNVPQLTIMPTHQV